MPLWIGNFTYTALGSTNDTSQPTCRQTWASDIRFSGIVTNAEERDLGVFKIVTLYVFGDAYGQSTYEGHAMTRAVATRTRARGPTMNTYCKGG